MGYYNSIITSPMMSERDEVDVVTNMTAKGDCSLSRNVSIDANGLNHSICILLLSSAGLNRVNKTNVLYELNR